VNAYVGKYRRYEPVARSRSSCSRRSSSTARGGISEPRGEQALGTTRLPAGNFRHFLRCAGRDGSFKGSIGGASGGKDDSRTSWLATAQQAV
jgi:hypothetical protein